MRLMASLLKSFHMGFAVVDYFVGLLVAFDDIEVEVHE
jgi:hypothetical protein